MLKQLVIPLAVLALSFYVNTARADSTDDTQAELNEMADKYNEKVESERDEVVCEWVAPTGSRIKEKRCRTKTQVKYDADEAKRYATKPKQSYKSN